MKIDFESASRHDFYVELIYNGCESPSWITISKLRSNPKIETDFGEVITQLENHPGIAHHCHRGCEDTYRISPGVDGFVVTSLLTDALERLESNLSCLKMIKYGDEPIQSVSSFDQDVVVASLKIQPENRL